MGTVEIFLICLWVILLVIIIAGIFLNKNKEIELRNTKLNLFPFRNFNKTYYVIFSLSLIVITTLLVILSCLEYSESSNKFFT